ncbi:replication protein [Pseudomonas typographi]|uniref:Bacteriophage lambda Replication protein O N-terminal domain-containing protein n=4 Tax=Pseudomonas typographi TaxID=2715964 RepID=A0ABR7ZA78_9PSED|nr:replication protein [Pseudomonas typographi]MBD1602465.1 hypothetical protein [Pseudomonas typographi]
MTNIFPIDKSRGFTRMDNDLYEALIGAELSGRELRVALAIHRLTAGYNVPEARIAASVIAEMSGIHREDVSRAMCELIRQRVIYRTGGSRSPIGFAPANEWSIDTKNTHPSKSKQAPQCGDNATSNVAFLPHNKERNTNTTSDEVVGDSNPAKPKADRKQAFGKTQMLADNPHGIAEQLVDDYLSLRKTKRAPITARVWANLNSKLTQCKAFGVTADQAIALAVENGWQGFEVDWVTKRIAAQTTVQPTQASRHHGFADRDYTAGLTLREDGNYAF